MWETIADQILVDVGKGWAVKTFSAYKSGLDGIIYNTISSSASGGLWVSHTLECYTMDVIGSCAFGIDCNSFTDPFSDFCKYSKKIFQLSRIKRLRALIINIFPYLGKALRVKLMPRDVTKFFLNIVTHSVKHRRENGIVRNDFLQVLMELVDNNKDIDSISFSEMVAQVYVFFIAGFETSSATMSFCLMELCLNPEVQEKLREEVNLILNKHNGTITYESLKEMTYMDAVINETLRKYPPVPVLNRRCIQDYHLHNSDIIIRKGIKITIPLIALHNDPEYFPNPEKFDPNRFTVENKHLIIPFTYMPFGDGPRACIGIRFGIMQTKIGLVTMLRDYKFSLSEKMKIPIKFKLHSFMTAVEGGVWLNATKI
ncbi:hypothetical protein RI129_007950 [Pyrocoelia pectoralis]|uniref:Cytochrome P450 n=1 Tax=Pyrocoelia pectoralis TaxID=417401 RepID=A0AAN7ZFB4_9COLE